MIVFIEGPDGSGKSTLAKRLSEDMGWPIESFSWPKTEKEKKQMFLMYVRFISAHHNVIVDRGWWSELVYGPIMRNGASLSIEDMLKLEAEVMRVQGGMVIHCTNDAEILHARLQRRGDDYIDIALDNVKRIKDSYEDLMHGMNHNMPVMRYDNSTNMSPM